METELSYGSVGQVQQQREEQVEPLWGPSQALTPSWFSVCLSEWRVRASVFSSKGVDIHGEDSEDLLNE